MAIGGKPFSLQAPEDIAKEYGGNKQKIIQAAKMGIVDPTAALMAGMFIDRMRSAQMLEQQAPQTVADEVFAPPAPPMQAAGLGATPPAAAPGANQMGPAPQGAMPPQAAGLDAAPVPEAMFSAGGGIVGYAAGDNIAYIDEEGVPRDIGGARVMTLEESLSGLGEDIRETFQLYGTPPSNWQRDRDIDRLTNERDALASALERGVLPPGYDTGRAQTNLQRLDAMIAEAQNPTPAPATASAPAQATEPPADARRTGAPRGYTNLERPNFAPREGPRGYTNLERPNFADAQEAPQTPTPAQEELERPAAPAREQSALGPIFETRAVEAIPGINITSRQRTRAENERVGGVATSYHLTDNARDFTPGDSGLSMDQLHAQLRRLFPNADVINEGDHVHVEPSPGQARTGGAGGLGNLVPGARMTPQDFVRLSTPRDVGSPMEFINANRELFEELLPETAAIGETIQALQDRNAPEEVKKQRSQDLWGALANFGFRWASTGNLAESAQEGLGALQETLSGRKEQQLEDLLRIAELQGVQREQAMAPITLGYQQYMQERGFSQQEAGRMANFLTASYQMDESARRAVLEAMLDTSDSTSGPTQNQRISAFNSALADLNQVLEVTQSVEGLQRSSASPEIKTVINQLGPEVFTNRDVQIQAAQILAGQRLDAALSQNSTGGTNYGAPPPGKVELLNE